MDNICVFVMAQRIFRDGMRVLESRSVEETLAIGEELGRQAKAGDVFCLCGSLGMGKTVFAKGFARGLGIEGNVNSPTFTLLQVYESGRLPLYHFDLYRLIDDGAVGVEDLEEIGFFECLDGDGVSLIEWAEGVLGVDGVWVWFEENNGVRKIKIT